MNDLIVDTIENARSVHALFLLTWIVCVTSFLVPNISFLVTLETRDRMYLSHKRLINYANQRKGVEIQSILTPITITRIDVTIRNNRSTYFYSYDIDKNETLSISVRSILFLVVKGFRFARLFYK